MIFSLPYIVLICIFGFFSFLYNNTNDGKARAYIVCACVGIVIFFFGFRGFCFYDWTSYYPTFYHYSLYDLSSLPVSDWPYEPAFSILMCLCRAIINDYTFFAFICTVINTVLLMRFLSRTVDNIPFALMICFSMNGLVLFTDLMRNSISILILVNALEYIEKRKIITYFIFCICATMFHLSSILYFPLYFFLHIKFNKWVLLAVFISGNLVYLLHIPVFLSVIKLFAGLISPDYQYKIDTYMNFMPDAGFKISIGYLERLLTGILLFCYLDKLKSIREGRSIYINGLMMYFVMFFFFSEFKVISLRLSYPFSFGYWIIWYDLVKCFVIDNNRKLFVAFVCIYCVLKMYGSTNYVVARYDNVLFGAQPYHIRENIYNKHFNEITK